MKLESLKYGYQPSSLLVSSLSSYWPAGVTDDLARQDWALTDVREQLDLGAWQAATTDLPRDPYVNRRWKRMSWLALDEDGEMKEMGPCPMAQGGAFNDAASMADRLRYYAPLTEAFMARADVKSFVKAWARLWGLQANEPILMQITGVRGEGQVDPLQGQGIHADGCKALSIMVVRRENLAGGENHLYVDKAGSRRLADLSLAPGDVLHLRDDKLFHSVDAITQQDPRVPFERFIVIINSRFVDPFQNRILRRHFPEAILHDAGR